MLEGKEMGFKVVKVTMSPRYIWMMRNWSAIARVFRWTPYGLGRKVSCHPFCRIEKKGRWTYDLKINALLIFCNLLAIGSCSCHMTKLMVFTCCRSRFCIELVVSLQSWLRFVGVRAMDVVYTGNPYNTSDIFRGRSIIETVNWLG